MKQAARLFAFAVMLVFFLGCGGGTPVPPQAKTQGRPETKGIETASAVGHDGKVYRKKIDRVLDQSDARARQLEESTAEVKTK